MKFEIYIIQCLVFNKTIIPLTLVGYELMIADSVLRTSSGYLIARIKRACVEYIVKYKVQNSSQF